MNGANLGIRLGRQKAEQGVRGLTFLDLPHGSPIGSNSRDCGEWSAIVEREPDVATLGPVELTEGRERHDAAMFDANPTALDRRRSEAANGHPAY